MKVMKLIRILTSNDPLKTKILFSLNPTLRLPGDENDFFLKLTPLKFNDISTGCEIVALFFYN